MNMLLNDRRRGAMVPLVAIALIGLLGFVALAIDIGVIAIARNRCQNAADAAALAGARTLNGDVVNNNNYANVGTNAKDAAGANTLLGQNIDKNNVSVKIGAYSYDYSLEKFVHYPDSKPTGENWTAVESTVTSGSQNSFFAQLLGSPVYSTTATAVAAHRARHVIIISDISS
jgi:Flp pilus assembly protein TadG